MPETLLSRFFANADRLGARPLVRYHAGRGEAGRWVPVGWRTAAQLVRDLASALIELGQARGDALAIVSQTRREWMTADLGNLAAGGVTVGVYPTLTPEQTRYVIAHCEARIAVVENAAQLAKIDAQRAGMPKLETVVVIDPEGVPARPGVIGFAELLARGRAARHDVDRRVAELRLEDAALFVYTSGTTGPPKGAMLTHGNLVAALRAMDALPLEDGDVGFSFLPLAHVLQRAVDYRGLWAGMGGWIGRSIETVIDDLAVARPTIMAAVPRIFEKVYAKIQEGAAASPPAKRRIFAWALGVGRQVSRARQAKRPIPPALAAQHRLAKALVFDKLRARLGGKIRLFITGGAPIAVEILEFFDAADIRIVEGWGMTETVAAGTLNLPGDARFGSIGKPLPGIELRLDEDGEILVRGGNVFSGYFKDAEATKAAFTEDGWFRTGDIGTLDADGFFRIVDRKKDLLITAAGKNIAPQNIENLLKGDPRISQAMAIGDRRPYVVALIAVAPEVRAQKSEAELVAMVDEIVAQRNQELAGYERVKKFRLLPADLTQESGELTPTLKLKRKVVAEKYAALIEEMYAEARKAEPRAAGG
jgi:long-chain acyl-CoA synthetase